MRIDHRSKSLSFGTDLMVAQKEDVPEGPYIQSMPSEQIRNQLTSMSRVLHKAIKLVQPEDRQVDTESQLSHRNTGKSLFYFAVKNDSKFEIAHLDKRSM